ncbi:MAG: acyl-CoA dehydrogenase family protein [Dehalococcoidia bacterium]|nr:acyl-CoA dehydrogenase family protein [Dehalococcoidia bacterium]
MEFGFTMEQDILRKSVRQFMDTEAPLTHLREMEADAKGYSPSLWRQIAGLDWIGIDYPDQYAGLGGSFVDVAVVVEEMGRKLFPGPYIPTAILAGQALLAGGNEQQKSELLPKIIRGETILTFALTEPSNTYEAWGVETRATLATGGGFVLNGTKIVVPFAHVADLIIVAAHTGPSEKDGPTEGNISLFLVDPGAAGVRISPIRITSNEKVSAVVLENVPVAAADRLGASSRPLGGDWPVVEAVLSRGKAAMCAEMVGAAQGALDMAVNYAKERTQFGGPIGRFQSIQHTLASLATEVQGARLLTYKAAVAIAGGDPNSVDASMAKAYVSEVFLRTTRAASQIHGGYAFMKETDISLYYLRAKAAEAILGGPDANRELVAQQMGL